MLDRPYPSTVELHSREHGGQGPAPSAGMLEAEIARIVQNTFNIPSQPDYSADNRTAWDGKGSWQQLPSARQETEGAGAATDLLTDVNGSIQEYSPSDFDIKIYDSEKLAEAASSFRDRVRSFVIIASVLAVGLSIVLFGGWFFRLSQEAVRSSVLVEQKVASHGNHQLPTSSPRVVEPSQQRATTVLTSAEINRPVLNSGRRDPHKVLPTISAPKVSARAPQSTSSPSAYIHPQSKASATPFPETKPTTIDGWVIREIANGKVVLQGPSGVWSVSRGDTVPGLGMVDSVVLWGGRWIVSTSKGLITTQ